MFLCSYPDPEGQREHRIGRAPRGGERHQTVADRDTEEGLKPTDVSFEVAEFALGLLEAVELADVLSELTELA